MHFSPTEKVALFLDGANLHAAMKALDLEVDFRSLLSFFRRKCHLVRALYYTTLLESQGQSSLRPLVDWLEYNGFSMVTKTVKEFTTASGQRRFKGSMKIELTVDALRMANSLDHIILVTGDGDYRPLVAALQEQGTRVSVVSTVYTEPAMVADELRRQADQFIDLIDLAPMICRERRPPAAVEVPLPACGAP